MSRARARAPAGVVVLLLALAACGSAEPLPEPGPIVFSAQPDAADAYGWQLFVVDADGTGLRRLTRTDGDGSPAWSPDGSRVAFSRQDDFGDQIWLVDADGANERRLTPRELVAGGPSWSPDGESIAYSEAREYVGDDDEVESWIRVVTADGVASRVVADAEGADAAPLWSRDGERISFWSDRDHRAKDELGEVYVVDVDGGGERRLTETRGVDSYAWSPSWDDLVISAPASGGGLDLFLLDGDGAVQRRLTHTPEDEFGPLFSPDGRRVAFDRGSFGDLTWIVVLDLEDGTETALSPEDLAYSVLAWSPDGRRLAVDGGGVLELIDVETGAIQSVDGPYYGPLLGADWAAAPGD